MKKTVSTIFILILFLAIGVTEAKARQGDILFRLKDKSKAKGETILLGEVAEIEGNDEQVISQLQKIPLSKSPLLGYTKIITPQKILFYLGKNYPTLQNITFSGPDRCLVERSCQEFSAKELEEIFIDQFYKNFSKKDIKIEHVAIHNSQKIKVPEGKIEFNLLIPRPPKNHKESFALKIKRDQKLIKQIWLSGRLSYFIYTFISAKDLHEGEKVTIEDIIRQKNNFIELKGKRVQNFSQIEKLICSRFIPAGTVLTVSMFKRHLLIKKGAIIKMIAETETLYVVSLGKALSDGFLGDTILVQNLNSKKKVYGEVKGENQISIYF